MIQTPPEDPSQTREWEILESWNALNAAAEAKRKAEQRYQPPPNCDFDE